MQMQLGNDERLCRALIPSFPLGCRRITPAPGYLESVGRPNVTVETEEIRRFVPKGIQLRSGRIVEVDAIICATGFDLSFRPRFPIIGRDGNLQDIWGNDDTPPKAYMSCAVAGLPNYLSKFPYCG